MSKIAQLTKEMMWLFILFFIFFPLFPDGLSGRDQPVELLNPPRVNHMPSSGKKKLLLNIVPILGMP